MAARSKKGYIHLWSVEPGYNVSDGFYFKIKFTFWYSPAYYLRTDLGSLRFYYRGPNQAQGEASYVDITEENADVFIKPGVVVNLGSDIVRIMNPTSTDYYVEYTLKNLTPSTTYAVRIWLRLFNSKGTIKTGTGSKAINSPPNAPVEATTDSYEITQPLFCVAGYNITEPSGVPTLDSIIWQDFTDCIKLTSYDVNFEDINEDWDDANYVTHRIRVRQRVNGKFEMIFPTMERFKLFLGLLEKSRQLNGQGPAYVQLKVQINNSLDDVNQIIPLSDVKCSSYMGTFFIKIDNNAWIQPIFGHYDKYSPLSITIQEA